MSTLLQTLGLLALFIGAACSICILIDAFKSAAWKGFACLLCFFYFAYYSLFEFEHDNKWLVVLGSVIGSLITIAMSKFT